MRTIRKNTFETNSSSTHSVTMCQENIENYVDDNDEILITFVDTSKFSGFGTLQEKLSYLVSHIANYYKDANDNYESFIDDIKHDWDFIDLEDFIKTRYNKRIVFPENFEGHLEDIVDINHQLYEYDFADVLKDMCSERENEFYFEIIFQPKAYIEIGRD